MGPFREGMTKTVWVSQDGRKMPIAKMHDRHLMNILNIIHKTAQQVAQETGEPPERISKALVINIPCLPAMIHEAEKRGLG